MTTPISGTVCHP